MRQYLRPSGAFSSIALRGIFVALILIGSLAQPHRSFAQTQNPPAQSETPEATGTLEPSTTPEGDTDLPAQVNLLDLDFRDFPVVRGSFQLRCPSCKPAPPLNRSQVMIAEDEMEIQASDLQAEYTGVHLILAVNPTAYWLSHNNKWVSALDYTAQALKRLINRPETNGSDLFEFYSNPDIKRTGMIDGVSFSDSLADYIETSRPLESSQASFQAALDALIADKSGREKVLIYASPIPAYIYLADFQAMLKTAQEEQIRVHFWTMDPFTMMQTQTGKDTLEEVRKTGGEVTFFTYEMTELPNPLDFLQGAGYTYKFNYHSFLRASGKPQISVSIKRPGEQPLLSNLKAGNLQILAPKISFIAPPEALSFTPKPEGDGFEPETLPLTILIEFPDAHPRNINLATLYLNGSVVQKNEKPPFGSFELDLQRYLDREEIELKAKLEDELGMSAETPPLMIRLDVPAEDAVAQTSTESQSPLVIPALVLLLALLGTGFWLLRKRRRLLKPTVPAEASEVKEEKTPADPPSPRKLSPFTPEKEKLAETYEIQNILASFNRLDNENMPAAEKPSLVFSPRTIIGRSREHCQICFDDPSIDEEHAELLINEDGSATIRDLGSAAGTWLDFKAIELEPVKLHHRAILQFGNIRVRFNSRDRVVQALQPKAPAGEK